LIVVDAPVEVIEWHEQDLLPLDKALTHDPRCRRVHGHFFTRLIRPGAFEVTPHLAPLRTRFNVTTQQHDSASDQRQSACGQGNSRDEMTCGAKGRQLADANRACNAERP